MDRKQFALYGTIIVMAMGAVAGYSVSIGNMLLPVIAVVTGILLLHLGRKRVTEVLEDERIYRISEKASRRILQILGIGMALIGVSIMAADKYTEAGYALGFSACALVLLYMIFYGYYSRRSLD